jgi:hypothetical protein
MRGDVPLAHGELVVNALTFVGHSSGSPASDRDKDAGWSVPGWSPRM